jgi:8-oxo-dGTP pyrophosphatase MutT (NUDIX family)
VIAPKAYIPQRLPGTGLKDLTKVEMHEIRTGADVQGVRPKRDGILFVRKRRPEGTFLEGDYSIPVPPDCKIESAECVHGHFWILHPYGRGTFEMVGKRFTFSEWSDSGESEEGMVILYKGEEKRIKRYPTVEVLVKNGMANGLPVDADDGVWEVYYDGVVVVPVMYRPECTPHQNPWNYLLSLPFLAELGCYTTGKRVVYSASKSGIEGSVSYIQESVFLTGLGSELLSSNDRSFSLGRLLAAYNLPVSDIRFEEKNGYTLAYSGTKKFYISQPPPSMDEAKEQFEKQRFQIEITLSSSVFAREIISSKAFIFHGQSLLLVQEGKKPLDLVGGKANAKETPDVTMQREFEEELGVPPPKLSYLCMSYGYEDGTVFKTYLYYGMIDKRIEHPLVTYTSLASLPMYVQPWLTRFIGELQRYSLSLPCFTFNAFEQTDPSHQLDIILRHEQYARLYSFDVTHNLEAWRKNAQRQKRKFSTLIREKFISRGWSNDVAWLAVCKVLGRDANNTQEFYEGRQQYYKKLKETESVET